MSIPGDSATKSCLSATSFERTSNLQNQDKIHHLAHDKIHFDFANLKVVGNTLWVNEHFVAKFAPEELSLKIEGSSNFLHLYFCKTKRKGERKMSKLMFANVLKFARSLGVFKSVCPAIIPDFKT